MGEQGGFCDQYAENKWSKQKKKFKLSTLNNPISTCTSMNVSFILFVSCLFHDKRAQIQCILLPHIYGCH